MQSLPAGECFPCHARSRSARVADGPTPPGAREVTRSGMELYVRIDALLLGRNAVTEHVILGRLLALVVLAVVVMVEPAPADSILATVPAPTRVRSWRRTAVLSLFDSRSNSYRLAVSRSFAAPEPVPDVAPADKPFDADIGPGPDGTAVIVYARCAGNTCHLFRTTPTGGGEIPLAGATSVDGSETAPTVWRTRLAFARTYATGSARVYVRPLDAPASVRSTRLPGVPGSFTGVEGHRRAISDGELPELELRGTSLAEIIHWERADAGVCG